MRLAIRWLSNWDFGLLHRVPRLLFRVAGLLHRVPRLLFRVAGLLSGIARLLLRVARLLSGIARLLHRVARLLLRVARLLHRISGLLVVGCIFFLDHDFFNYLNNFFNFSFNNGLSLFFFIG